MLLYHLDAIKTLPLYHNAMIQLIKNSFHFTGRRLHDPSILANPTVCSGVHRGRHRHTHFKVQCKASMNTIYEHKLITRVRRTNQSPATQSSWAKVLVT